MADENTIAKVASTPEPTSPAAAAGLSVGKDFLVILAGISTIWTCFSTGGLAAVYSWLNSIQGAPFLALASLGAVLAWGSVKKWMHRKLTAQQREVIQTIATAPPEEAAATIQALRDASPPAAPINRGVQP